MVVTKLKRVTTALGNDPKEVWRRGGIMFLWSEDWGGGGNNEDCDQGRPEGEHGWKGSLELGVWADGVVREWAERG